MKYIIIQYFNAITLAENTSPKSSTASRSPSWTEEQMEEKPGASWRLAIFLPQETFRNSNETRNFKHLEELLD